LVFIWLNFLAPAYAKAKKEGDLDMPRLRHDQAPTQKHEEAAPVCGAVQQIVFVFRKIGRFEAKRTASTRKNIQM